MVIHDSDQQQRWAEQQQKQHRKPEKKKRGPLSLIAVQSLACCCLVLLVLLFRLAGGEGYEQLRQSFHKAMQGNEWVNVLVGWLDESAKNDASSPGIDGKENDFTQSNALQIPEIAELAACKRNA